MFLIGLTLIALIYIFVIKGVSFQVAFNTIVKLIKNVIKLLQSFWKLITAFICLVIYHCMYNVIKLLKSLWELITDFFKAAYKNPDVAFILELLIAIAFTLLFIRLGMYADQHNW